MNEIGWWVSSWLQRDRQGRGGQIQSTHMRRAAHMRLPVIPTDWCRVCAMVRRCVCCGAVVVIRSKASGVVASEFEFNRRNRCQRSDGPHADHHLTCQLLRRVWVSAHRLCIGSLLVLVLVCLVVATVHETRTNRISIEEKNIDDDTAQRGTGETRGTRTENADGVSSRSLSTLRVHRCRASDCPLRLVLWGGWV